MRAVKTDRGFVVVTETEYPTKNSVSQRLIGESSAIGEYDDALENPGSSFLWVGDRHHLNREQVAELIQRMQHWLDTGRLAED